MVTLLVDQKKITAPQETNLLTACLANGIYIPHLCHLEDEKIPAAACRLCFVAVDGLSGPVAACGLKVEEGLVVTTDTPVVRRLQKTALRLLLSVHHLDCGNCHANKRCELQKIARFLKIGLRCKPLESHLVEMVADHSHPVLMHFPQRCILCGKCIRTCRRRKHNTGLTFSGRGFDTRIRFFASPSNCKECAVCAACVDVCPVGALALKRSFRSS